MKIINIFEGPPKLPCSHSVNFKVFLILRITNNKDLFKGKNSRSFNCYQIEGVGVIFGTIGGTNDNAENLRVVHEKLSHCVVINLISSK